MKKVIWIYEYKDDDTPVGATLFEGDIEALYKMKLLQLPHLSDSWHYRVEVSLEEEE